MVTASLSRSSVCTTGPRSKREKQNNSTGPDAGSGTDKAGSKYLPGLWRQEERASKLAEELENLTRETGKQMEKKAELWWEAPSF